MKKLYILERYITNDPYTLKEDPVKLIKAPCDYSLDEVKKVPDIFLKQYGLQSKIIKRNLNKQKYIFNYILHIFIYIK